MCVCITESLDQCVAIHTVTLHTFCQLVHLNGFSCITATLIGCAVAHAAMIVFMTALRVNQINSTEQTRITCSQWVTLCTSELSKSMIRYLFTDISTNANTASILTYFWFPLLKLASKGNVGYIAKSAKRGKARLYLQELI